MWPFKVSTAKDDVCSKDVLFQEAVSDLKAFRDVGEKFTYLGISMIVESHSRYYPFGNLAQITAGYRNTHGELKYACFCRRELPALQAENP